MSTETQIRDSIEQAATAVGDAWPLHSFVTANPLSGFEDQPFHGAVSEAEELFDADGYPSPEVFRRAWEAGKIAPGVLRAELADHGYDTDPETSLERMDSPSTDADAEQTVEDEVDRLLTKWLSSFLDQGQAQWSMPNREQGFYAAFHAVARHDGELPNAGAIADLPEDPVDALEHLLADHPADRLPDVFEHHLTALPGWTGYVKQRAADGGDWQSEYPITLAGYLAVRLTLADLVGAPIDPLDAPGTTRTVDPVGEREDVPLRECWLTAWEASYREELVDAVSDASESHAEADDGGRPDAQLVFCIDTRSEILRRHLEATGDYDTHGYAGFFGVPMRYEGYDADVAVDACPPIVDAQHHVADRPTKDADGTQADYDRWSATLDAGGELLASLKKNAATAFSFVETAGSGYGAALAARTLAPARAAGLLDAADDRTPDDHEFCAPGVDYNPDGVHELREGLTLDEKVEYAATAFDLMGWETFGRLVVFTGHASETANNPFDSSLDCGACAGNPGGPSARVLAAICNDEAVVEELRERGFDVPEDTVFLAGEHNTTTDEVTLYDDGVPASHREDLEQLRADLDTAREGAAAERAASMGAEGAGVRETERRAADWAETRPEWGLAGNAGFVVGPRDLTEGLDLDGRAFLHSYDWTTDPDGDALAAIMPGPMVVTQWINSQYYFATVDTAVFGSGSKVTHNPVGNVGVYQGNGGDLMTGLPHQSVMAADDDPHHQPLRLSTVIHAPVDRVTDVLADHEELTDLLDNGWLSLTVVDPTQDHRAFHYEDELAWTPMSESPDVDAAEPTAPTVADD
ncbi:DUF2309 domain-containing protein [Halomicroarcula sp. F13]|uniref:Probable inorganic carbon transporter subunit DabA n=1 Tax=Haloarcula rubra TaxID=2487747 RepID=A0AAW4PNI0_9EURY|nr:DUF2309 domain-containing protein [Halomicroarcula rubra]MBX0322100.1 DUF2309 domain-containing protein [Halomicroarcula rubra]